MGLFNTNVKCSICNTSLTLWNVHTCTRCGRKICSRHSSFIKRPHSYVLYSVCAGCSGRAVTFPQVQLSSQQIEHVTKTPPRIHTTHV